MRRLIPISLLVLLAFMFIMLISPAHANPWVYTCKEDGTPTDHFSSGEKVRIKAYSQNPLPYEIIVIDPNGVIRFTDTSNTTNYDRTVSGITDKPGWWEVKAGTASTHYASAWYQVIPEVPFGTMAILLSMFGALSFFAVKKKHNFLIRTPL